MMYKINKIYSRNVYIYIILRYISSVLDPCDFPFEQPRNVRITSNASHCRRNDNVRSCSVRNEKSAATQLLVAKCQSGAGRNNTNMADTGAYRLFFLRVRTHIRTYTTYTALAGGHIHARTRREINFKSGAFRRGTT